MTKTITIKIARQRFVMAMIQRDALLRYQADKIAYHEFMTIAIKARIDLDDFYNDDFHMFVEWLQDQETNKLANESSGSLYTALVSYDSLFHDEDFDIDGMTDDEYNSLATQIFDEYNCIDWYPKS